MLNSGRIFWICSASLFSLAILWFTYDEWLRHLVDQLAGKVIDASVCDGGHSNECEAVMGQFKMAQTAGYGIYLLAGTLAVSYFLVQRLIKQSDISIFRDFSTVAAALTIIVFSSYFAGMVSLPSAIFHSCLLLAGLGLAFYTGQRKGT